MYIISGAGRRAQVKAGRSSETGEQDTMPPGIYCHDCIACNLDNIWGEAEGQRDMLILAATPHQLASRAYLSGIPPRTAEDIYKTGRLANQFLLPGFSCAVAVLLCWCCLLSPSPDLAYLSCFGIPQFHCLALPSKPYCVYFARTYGLARHGIRIGFGVLFISLILVVWILESVGGRIFFKKYSKCRQCGFV